MLLILEAKVSIRARMAGFENITVNMKRAAIVPTNDNQVAGVEENNQLRPDLPMPLPPLSMPCGFGNSTGGVSKSKIWRSDN